MNRFLLGNLTHKTECSSDVFVCQTIFLLNALDSHAAREASHDHRDEYARTANHGLAVTNRRIDNDAGLIVHDETIIEELAIVVEFSAPNGFARMLSAAAL